ncbi:hypothetical protein HBA54_08615 [Pelagibius litoralis]|uniref:Uncharacterized protein n=1 Tax=Pelagibius litoralis TaxID=374515 RepID=A0A967C8F5_9PROT|nr:hypothetical protein [Pelagibius litoralis]NIA68652.1 hypothetical protein [Pelagibius litoralis]
MLTAENSLEFILEQVQVLGQGDRAHEKAAYRALIHMTQRWAEPTDLYISEDLQMAERIGQDLADIARHIQDIQHSYMKALFETQDDEA